MISCIFIVTFFTPELSLGKYALQNGKNKQWSNEKIRRVFSHLERVHYSQ